MRVVFSKNAALELVDAVDYFNQEHPALGNRSENEVKKAVERISEYPTSWSLERGEIRKYLMHKFPYKLLYSIEKDHLFIIAIAHQHRRPDYWIDIQ